MSTQNTIANPLPLADVKSSIGRFRLRQLRHYLLLPVYTTPREVFRKYKTGIYLAPIKGKFRWIVPDDLLRIKSSEIPARDAHIADVMTSWKWDEYRRSPQSKMDGERGREEKARQEVQDGEDEMVLDWWRRKTVLRSFNTEAKHPMMRGKEVQKMWTTWNGEKMTHHSEIVPYEESKLSICTVVLNEDEVQEEFNGENERYVWYGTEPFSKERMSRTGGSVDRAAGINQINSIQGEAPTNALTLRVEIVDSSAGDDTSPSLTSGIKTPTSNPSALQLQDSSSNDMALDNVDSADNEDSTALANTRATPFDINLPTLHAFNPNQAFSENLMNISSDATILPDSAAQHDITQPMVLREQLTYRRDAPALQGQNNQIEEAAVPDVELAITTARSSENFFIVGDGSDTDEATDSEDDEEMRMVEWEDVPLN